MQGAQLALQFAAGALSGVAAGVDTGVALTAGDGQRIARACARDKEDGAGRLHGQVLQGQETKAARVLALPGPLWRRTMLQALAADVLARGGPVFTRRRRPHPTRQGGSVSRLERQGQGHRGE
jgi:hypothetical protein